MAAEPTFAGMHFWVEDMTKTLAFYRAIGLPADEVAEDEIFARISLANGMHLEFGSDRLTRGYHPGFEPRRGGSPNCLQFHLESRAAVDAMWEKLTAAGYEGHLPPFDAFWGSRYCEVRDPDGNVAGFQSPRDAERTPTPIAD